MYYISNYTAIDYSAYAMLHIKHVLVLKFGLLAGLEKRDLLRSSQLNQEILRAVNVVTSGDNTSNSSSRRLNRTDIGLIGLIGLILVEERHLMLW